MHVNLPLKCHAMKTIFLIVISLLLFDKSPNLSFGQSFGDRRIEAMHVEELGVPAVLREVSRETGLSIGVEMDVLFGTEKRIEFNFPGGTLTDLARFCAALIPNASWRIANDRTLVFSESGDATILAAVPLNYPGVSSVTRKQVWSDLANRPELENWLHSHNCQRLDIFRGYEWRGDRPSISIPKGKISLEDLLETAAINSDARYWSILRNTRENKCEIIITLWS
jgi:hypothetical protein